MIAEHVDDMTPASAYSLLLPEGPKGCRRKKGVAWAFTTVLLTGSSSAIFKQASEWRWRAAATWNGPYGQRAVWSEAAACTCCRTVRFCTLPDPR